MPRLTVLGLEWEDVLPGLQRLEMNLDSEAPTRWALDLEASTGGPTRQVRVTLLELLRPKLAKILRLPELSEDIEKLLDKVDELCTDETLSAGLVEVDLVLDAVMREQ